jgi:hypothetical protein
LGHLDGLIESKAMKISPFLTAIARDYKPQIVVGFGDLTFLKTKPLGIAWQWNPKHYEIQIDRNRLICPHQVLYMFYHELGHIIRGHVGYRRCSRGRPFHEEEANNFAFAEMGMLSERGEVKEECTFCYQCMKAKSEICLKKIPPKKGLDIGEVKDTRKVYG